MPVQNPRFQTLGERSYFPFPCSPKRARRSLTTEYFPSRVKLSFFTERPVSDKSAKTPQG